MTESTKIDLRYRRIQQIDDVTDLVEMLFPGNRNQQHAAARILLALRESGDVMTSLSDLGHRYGTAHTRIEGRDGLRWQRAREA